MDRGVEIIIHVCHEQARTMNQLVMVCHRQQCHGVTDNVEILTLRAILKMLY